jgi:uncharacterized iron-regulated protein
MPEPMAHILLGKIWDTRSGNFVDYDALKSEATKARHLLLGETHINPEHHRIQAEVIGDLLDDGQSFALVLEIFETDQQQAIDLAIASDRVTADDVADATGIRDSGWDWDGYRPLVQLGLEGHSPILAGNAPRAEVRQVAFSGLEAVPGDRIAELGLATPLSAASRETLTQVIIDSHCGHALGDMAERLVDAQRVRDATMADVMLTAPSDKSVLITGAGHARRDYGVPRYILERTPDANVVSVGLTEVAAGLTSPEDYVEDVAGEDTPFDYLWFTERAMFEDPCEKYRESLKTLGDHGQKAD